MPRKIASATGAKKLPKAPKLYRMAEKFPSGMVLKDLCKKEWQLGNVLGQGGFGLIYLADEVSDKPVNQKTAKFVIKIEPKDNGPLFCEIHFYQRVAKLEYIQAFIAQHRLQYLGIPPYIGAGLEKYNSQEYRFLVMPRFGTDLQKLLLEHGNKFAPQTTFAVALRMVDALQYLHEKEYVHADIKAANILLGFSGGHDTPNQVYLVDYGLAYRYTVGSEHKDYKEDIKRAHNGTLEFTSRDAHKGLAPSRRGDLEILGFCMLQWLCGKLPWEDYVPDPNAVAKSKESFVEKLQNQLSKLLPGSSHVADCVYSYFQQVNNLEYHSTPNYNKIRDILRTGLNRSGQKNEWIIDFTVKGQKRKHAEPDSSEESSSSTRVSPKKSLKQSHPSPGVRQSPVKPPAKSRSPAVRKYSALKTATHSAGGNAPSTSGRKNFVMPPPTKVEQIVYSDSTDDTSSSSHSLPKKSPKRTHLSPRAGPAAVLSRKQSTSTLNGSGTSLIPSSSASLSNGRGALKSNRAKKQYPMPPPTKTSVTALTKTSTVRRVKRVVAVQSDRSIQTSPGLMNNK